MVLICGALGLGGAGIGFAWLDATLPDVFSFEAYRGMAHESSRMHAAGGELVATFGEEIRTVVPADRIPATVRFAIVCAEDAAFYTHPGLDIVGIARALWVDVTSGRYKQGASTITQQFAKTRFLDREKSFTRKAKELVLARKLEKKLGKEEILTLYANEVYFGHGRYGVEEASRFYFGRSVSDVDLAQAALLAGIVNSPMRFSPLRHPVASRGRRAYVLRQMRDKGYISAEDCVRAEAAPLPTENRDRIDGAGGYYTEAVRQFVLGKVDRHTLQHGGLRIEVALDVAIQRAAEAAVLDGLQRIDRQHRTAEPIKRYADAAAVQEGLRKLAVQQMPKPDKPLPWGRVLLGVVRGADPGRKAWRVDLGGREGWLPFATVARYRQAAVAGDTAIKAKATDVPAIEPQFQQGDLIRVSVRDQPIGPPGVPGTVLPDTAQPILLSPEFGPQAAFVALEPKTRLVRALVGGDSFALHPFDRALSARRQPGSTFKTFAMGAALEAGLVTPDSVFYDVAHTYTIAGRGWTPKNYSGRWDGKPYSLRDALAHSINSIAVAVAAQAGPDRVEEFARRVGIDSPMTVGLPLALGASGVTPLELTNAYATIAAGGVRRAPILVTRIVGRDGKDLYLAPRDEATPVLTAGVARALTDMLGEVVRRGSAKDAKVGHPVAGKTGTSNGSRDVWFVGFSAELCAGVWIGYDDRKPIAKGSGGTLAVPVWSEFMRRALDRMPVQPLPRLPHVLAGPIALPPAPGDPEAGAQAIDDEVLEENAAPLPETLVPPPLPVAPEDR